MVAIDPPGEPLAPMRWNPRQRSVGLMAGVVLAAIVLIAWVEVPGHVAAT